MSLVAAAALIGGYAFSPETRLDYDVNVTFDGFLPLFGGNEGTVEVDLDVRVRGLEPNGELLRASNEITGFEIKFNGARLPLFLDAVQELFPLTTVEVTRQGRIVSNDAPDANLPVRLPGLDVKRFPDITYLPVEFPEGEVSVGDTWSYEREFGEAPIVYVVTLEEMQGDLMQLNVRLEQVYEVYENELLEVVSRRDDAVRQVTTNMEGRGLVVFDTRRGVAISADIRNRAISLARPLNGGATQERVLNTHLQVNLRQPSMQARPSTGTVARTAPTPAAQTEAQPAWRRALGTVTERATTVTRQVSDSINLARVLFQLWLAGTPLPQNLMPQLFGGVLGDLARSLPQFLSRR